MRGGLCGTRVRESLRLTVRIQRVEIRESGDNPQASGPFVDAGASWIWPASGNSEPNQYLEFRHEFMLDRRAPDAKILVSADSNYALWLNGEFVNFGQYHDYPDDKTYDTLEVGPLLKPGRNVLCVMAYHQGADSFQYLPGPPGLIYALQAGSKSVVSGRDTIWRESPAYFSGSTAKITPQLGFTFDYVAGGDDGWRQPDYQITSLWKQIESGDETSPRDRKASTPRPLPKLLIGDRLNTVVCAQGVFTRKPVEGKTVAQLMQTDFLSARTSTHTRLPNGKGMSVSPSDVPTSGGAYFVVDLGREDAGVLEMDLEAGAGTIVDIAWGEHLDDLRVRASVGPRNFAARYVCWDGRQSFTHYFTRLAGRYIELHVSGIKDPFVLHYAGLRPTDYPLERRGSFSSPDGLQEMIYDTAARTLHLCMHEHYEDCPWREQALYAMDARNQALSGYYCFGEYAFPAASFSLHGRSIKDDGFLEMCAPARIDITIPSFSMAWVMESADHLLFSGDVEAAGASLPSVTKMMDISIGRMVDGLLPCPTGPRYWHFYDWAPGLDGTNPNGRGWLALQESRFDAPLNLFFCLALDSAARMSVVCGESRKASEYRSAADYVRAAFHPCFWDEKAGLYESYRGEGARSFHHELTQSLAILTGACPPDIAKKLRERLASEGNGMVETTLSQSLYKFEALLQEPGLYGKWVFDKIARDWGHMLRNGATSFWETIRGGDDFSNAGSLCHGWSGTPAYFYGAYLLGIRPTSPGFETFTVAPVEGVIPSASGTVPTPHGPINISWEMVKGRMERKLDHPSNTSPVDQFDKQRR